MIELIQNPMGYAFSACRKRFAIAAAGRRSGKTERAKRRNILRALIGTSFDTPRFGCCGPTHTQAKAVFWNDLKRMTKPVWAKEPSESELTIYIDNYHGTVSELCVRGLDKPQRIEGVPWDWFHIDEADDVKPGFWEEHLRPCLSDRLGGADFTGVPNGLLFIYDLSQRALNNDEYGFFSWPSSEVLPPAEIESAKRDLDERTYRQEYEASFENPTGRVYYSFDRNENIKEFPGDASALPLSVGMDFNVSPMTAVIFAEVGDTTWIVDDIVIPQNSNTHEMVKEIRNRYGARVINAYPDPAGSARKTSAEIGQSDHEILRQAGFKVFSRASTLSVRDGINAVNSRFCSSTKVRKMFVSAKCKNAPKALEKHSYKEGTSIPDQDGHEHLCDCIRYFTEYLHPIRERPEWGRG